VPPGEGPIRVVWGLHADLFDPAVRGRFAEEAFTVSNRLDRMGARLTDRGGVFLSTPPLSLVSDAIVPGDIQILGDDTPIVLLRDHQPTGGYPRIATVITADLDRFAQLRPGTEVRFEPASLPRAQALMKGAV
jgi:allophanate hydrolase subunit 2